MKAPERRRGIEADRDRHILPRGPGDPQRIVGDGCAGGDGHVLVAADAAAASNGAAWAAAVVIACLP